MSTWPTTTPEARSFVATGLDGELVPLRELRLRSRLMELIIFVALWALGTMLSLSSLHSTWPGIARFGGGLLGVVVSAIALNAFVLLLHEGMHHTLFANRWANHWVGALLGFPLLISFTAYQVMHIRHHQFLGDPRDPDDYENYTHNPAKLWRMHYGRLLCGAFLYLFLIPILSWRHGSSTDRRRVVSEYLLMAAAWIAAVAIVPGEALLWCWGLPVILVGYMTNVRGFTQHGITDAHDPFLASRTVRPNRLVEFCLLNENYHLEHHLFPEVPSYHLPVLHELIEPHLPRRVVTKSYLGFLYRFWQLSPGETQPPIGLEVRDCPALTLDDRYEFINAVSQDSRASH